MKKNRQRKTFLIPAAEYTKLKELTEDQLKGLPGISGSPVVLVDAAEYAEDRRLRHLARINHDPHIPLPVVPEAEATHYLVTGRMDADVLADATKLRARAQRRGKAMTVKQSQDLRAALKELPGVHKSGDKVIIHTYRELN